MRSVLQLIPVLSNQPAGDWRNKSSGRLPLLSARPMVITPVTQHHHPLVGTNYTDWWQRHVCKQLAQGCTRQCGGCNSNPRHVDHKAGPLTTRPPSHDSNSNMRIEWISERTEHLDIFLFSAHQSMAFYFRCSVYWWKGSVRFQCLKHY